MHIIIMIERAFAPCCCGFKGRSIEPNKYKCTWVLSQAILSVYIFMAVNGHHIKGKGKGK